MTKLNELESTLLSTIASRENNLVVKVDIEISKLSELITSEIKKHSEGITSMKIENVVTKDELLTKLGMESNRISSISSKTQTDIHQINELIQKIKTDL